MSELMLGTIIGGGIGVLGVILGSIIQGYFSNKNTQYQIVQRREEQENNIKFQKEQQEISRLIEERRKWIIPLWSTLKEYSEHIVKANRALMILQSAFPEGKPRVRSKLQEQNRFEELFKSLEQVLDDWKKCTMSIEMNEALISDRKLKTLINDVIVSGKSAPFIALFEFDKSSIESINESLKRADERVIRAFNRIEHLLSGTSEEE